MGVIFFNLVLLKSYFGYWLLIEDLGVIYGEDDCVCGCLGKYFLVFGCLVKL